MTVVQDPSSRSRARWSSAVVALALLASCARPREEPIQGAVDETPPPACEPAVRTGSDVSVMYATEWMVGWVAVAVCRGTEAETSDLSGFAMWLDSEARAGRIRPCDPEGASVVVTDAERAAAERVLPGVRDWCLEVVADI